MRYRRLPALGLGLLLFGCSNSTPADGPADAAWIQVKGKTHTVSGVGCLEIVNGGWYVGMTRKEDPCGKDPGPARPYVVIEVDPAGFKHDEYKNPTELPKAGAEYALKGFLVGDGPAGKLETFGADGAQPIKMKVLKSQKPYLDVELTGFTPGDQDKANGVEKMGGRFRIFVPPAFEKEPFYKDWH